MAQIKNIDGLSYQQVLDEVRMGGKFVYFPFVISIIILTFRRSSPIYFIKSGESAMGAGIGYLLITLFFGWWGIPFGPIFSIGALYRYFAGGKDVTQEVLSHFNQNLDNITDAEVVAQKKRLA